MMGGDSRRGEKLKEKKKLDKKQRRVMNMECVFLVI